MRRIVLISILLLIADWAYGQYRWEFGAKAGVANYLGDIGGYAGERRDGPVDMRFEQTNWALGAYTRYKVGRLLSIQAEFNAARIRGSDHLSENPARAARNLSFRNLIMELGVRPELTIFQDNDVGGRGYYNPDFRLYAFAGVAAIYHNPQGSFDGQNWDNLRELNTEGRNQPYSNFAFAIPKGIGLYFTHKKKHRFGWEFGWRTTFTDYLDDVSTVYGDPNQMTDLGAMYSNRTTKEHVEAVNNMAIQQGLPTVNAESFEISSITGENIHGNEQLGWDGPQKRGDASNNDSYLFTQFSYGYLIKGRSNFYRNKYSWIKRKRSVSRKTRAKF
jgi:hypothetical protein